MRETYNTPVAELVNVVVEDVICASQVTEPPVGDIEEEITED